MPEIFLQTVECMAEAMASDKAKMLLYMIGFESGYNLARAESEEQRHDG